MVTWGMRNSDIRVLHFRPDPSNLLVQQTGSGLMAIGRASDENRMAIYAKKVHQKKVDKLAKPLGIPIQKDKSRHRSAVVRAAIDLLYEKHFPRGGRPKHPFGLADLLYPANGRDYNPELAEADRLTLVFNDMKRWLPRHLDTMRARLQAGKHTDIFVLHPRNPYIAPIANVSEKALSVQEAEIGESVRLLCDGLWDYLRNTRIYGHRRFNTYSGVITEKKVMAVYYPIQRRYNDGFVHLYEKTPDPNAIYRQFEDDLAELARDCEQNVESYDLIKLFRPVTG